MRATAAVLALLTLSAAQEPAPSIDGRWVNPSGSVVIDIGACGASRCGTVKWASAQAIADARKGTDQLVGSDLLTGLTQTRPGMWQGTLFVPDEKIRAKAKITLIGTGQLKVEGCKLVICKSQIWNRSDQPLPATP
jgi:uncharacterized protein (DUF2147 family)